MTSIEWLVNVVQSCIAPNYIPKEIIEKAKEMHKAEQESLYTEEQVREALSESFKASQEGYNITSDEIIQSLKQPKKD
jgi:tRNA threonylcarbamoyladenosine modification (KEOPS) complex Cgi121 subunit